MSMIWNISSSFIQAFEMVKSGKKITPEEMFKRLSIMMGGDGESITKKQLDNYIAEAEKGDVKTNKSGLTALKVMQQNWDQISGGKDSITVGDLKDYTTLLAMAFAGSFTMSTTPDESTSKIEKADDDKKISSDTPIADLKAMLKEALGGTTDANDDSNADFISTLTNMIALGSLTSTVSVQA